MTEPSAGAGLRPFLSVYFLESVLFVKYGFSLKCCSKKNINIALPGALRGTYEDKLIRSEIIDILLELNVLEERKRVLVKFGSNVRRDKLVRELPTKRLSWILWKEE